MGIKQREQEIINTIRFIHTINLGKLSWRDCINKVLREIMTIQQIVDLGAIFGVTLEDCVTAICRKMGVDD